VLRLIKLPYTFMTHSFGIYTTAHLSFFLARLLLLLMLLLTHRTKSQIFEIKRTFVML